MYLLKGVKDGDGICTACRDVARMPIGARYDAALLQTLVDMINRGCT